MAAGCRRAQCRLLAGRGRLRDPRPGAGEEAAMSVLEVEELRKHFGGVRAVDGVSFSVAAGELVALIGPNGAGKSTCFNLINGQLRPDSGVVRLNGRDVAGRPPRELCRLGVGR